ncbi:hypothetical protein [Catenulispora subtropica]|uniref:hypothetical protein n=1 Tax=Catenulispora subtropica TaxID=450798 RepID=UPI0031E0344C
MTTYYWDATTLASPELVVAQTILTGARDGDVVAAFHLLLRSGERVPVAMAVAWFQYAEAQARWGVDNPYEAAAAEVLERARWLLRFPPMPAADSGAVRDEADHASALLAMTNLAEAQDADLIADVIERSSEPEVLANAAWAAGGPLEQADAPEPRLVEAIGRRAGDRTLDPRIRAELLGALRFADCERGAEIAMRLAEESDVEMQVAAAQVLAAAHLATHRPVVERLRASWPAGTIGVGNVDLLLEDQEDQEDLENDLPRT